MYLNVVRIFALSGCLLTASAHADLLPKEGNVPVAIQPTVQVVNQENATIEFELFALLGLGLVGLGFSRRNIRGIK